MNFRFINFGRSWQWLTLALLLLGRGVQSAPVRVTTWNLQPSAIAGTNGFSTQYQQNLIQEAADTLRKLNPDVILLQQVMDLQSCEELAGALKPETYNVTICSSFRNARNGGLNCGQVAILSKVKPYVIWSDAWQTSAQNPAAPGGVAFAAFRLDGTNVGFFSVQLGDGSAPDFDRDSAAPRQHAREESARQIVQLINSLRNWPTNRLQSLVVAGDFDTTTDDVRFVREKTISRLEQFGFQDAFADLPLEKRVTLPANGTHPDATMDYLFTRDAGVVLNPQTSQAALTEHWPITSDLDLNAAKKPPVTSPAIAAASTIVSIAHVRTNDPASASTPAPRPKATAASAKAADSNWWEWGTMAGAFTLLLLLGGFVLFRVRSKRNQSVSLTTTELVIAPRAVSDPARAHFVAEMSRWLKTRFVRRLVSDRAQLLEAQHAAALKVLAMEERLAKLEHQINERNREYEQRIDALLNELSDAQEENRELIHAKIALLKVEMEKKARQEALRSGR